MNLKSHYEPKILSFLRDHLFVTTRVHITDGNFLIGATFDSDRSRHLFFQPKQIGFGAAGRFSTFFDMFWHLFTLVSCFVFWGLRKSRGKKKSSGIAAV